MRIASLFSLVAFSHTLFALPFALLSAVLAANGIPDLPTLGWILLAMVGARSAALAFNRIIDRKIDALNPRTSHREIPAGVHGAPHDPRLLARWLDQVSHLAQYLNRIDHLA